MTIRPLALAATALAVLALPLAVVAQDAAAKKAALLRNPAALTEQAPATYRARFDTTRGTFVIQVNRDWAPIGADRFYNLIKAGFYDDVRFFRVLDGFMAQFGMNGNPAVTAIWRRQQLKDDPVKQSNRRGYVSFATAGPNTRTTQVFINFVDNSGLDKQGFAPFGEVVEGMSVVDNLYSGYGRNNVPDQGRITTEGNAYLTKEYPRLDYIKSATIEP
jgi:peptidyl-prolyl cis-trans isomerase A (cyclophilin A)